MLVPLPSGANSVTSVLTAIRDRLKQVAIGNAQELTERTRCLPGASSLN